MKKPKYTPTTLSDIKKEDGMDVYVYNNSMNCKVGSSVVISDIISEGGSQVDQLMVPVTWVPVNIGLQIPKELLLKSSNFLKCINSRMLVLVKTSEAEEFFRNDALARDELDRISSNISNIQRNEDNEKSNDLEIEGEIEGDVHTQVAEVCIREDITEEEQFLIVVNLHKTEGLSEDSLNFLIENSKFDKVKKFATDRLKK